jgi:hypothetical protein
MTPEEEALFGDPARIHNKLWCMHADTITDDDGQQLCVKCKTVLAPQVLTEQVLWDAADAIWSQGYHGPGLPPSFRRRLEDS